MAWISTAEPSNPIVVTATANLVGSDRAIARFYDPRETLLKASLVGLTDHRPSIECTDATNVG